jgi:hypothetical protein
MIALVLAAAVLAGVFIRWALANDRWEADLAALDDEELAAALREYPDPLERRKR